MRIYFVFKIKEEYIDLYKDTPNTLYNILNQMYYMKRNEIGYGFNLFNQMIERIDKFDLDKHLYVLLHTKMKYSKKGDEHVLNNLYKDEVSVLTVKNSYLLITTNQNNTSFFQILDQYASDFFICDFSNMDYFWLSSLKMLATSNAV